MTSDGQAILPLYELYIMSDNGEQKKDYTKDGIYIMNASVGEDTIYLTRARKQNQFFEEIDQDYISYKKEENNKMITTTNTYDTYAWSVLDIVFPSNFYLSDTASYRKTKYGSTDAYKDMQVQTKTRDGAYYVFDNATTIGLLLTLVIIFSSQAEVILSNPLHIVLIAVPLIIQTFVIFFIAYGASKLVRLPFEIAAPATTVGVLTEVPVMLTLVKIANRTKERSIMIFLQGYGVSEDVFALFIIIIAARIRTIPDSLDKVIFSWKKSILVIAAIKGSAVARIEAFPASIP